MNNVNETAAYCLEALKKAGADKAQCIVSASVTNEFNVDGGEFSLFRTLFDDGVNLVGFSEGRRGIAGINRVDHEAIDEAVRTCMDSARSGIADDAFDIAPMAEPRTFTAGAPVIDRDRLFMRSQELVEDIRRDFPKIVLEQMIVTHSTRNAAYMNSNGVHYEKLSGHYCVDLMYSAHDGDKASSFFGSSINTDSLEMPFIDLGSTRSDLAAVSKQIDTTPVSGKSVGTLVLTPGCLTEFLSYIIGNFASDMSLIDGTSLWKDKLGTQVADPRMTLSMSPHDKNVVVGEDFTGEGFVSEDYDLIKDGVLQSFALSLYGANKTGLSRAKNSSMNFVIPAGDRPLDEIIAGIKNGILVARFSGGNPGANGEFAGVAKNSFIIKDGKVGDAVSETMINGNLADMLKHLVDFSKERVTDGSTMLPYAAFDGITISGK